MSYGINKRVESNTNLSRYCMDSYCGLPILVHKGPCIESYLERSLSTIDRAIQDHPRTFAVRLDMRFPIGHDISYDSNYVMQMFIKSLKSRMKVRYESIRRSEHRAHASNLRYVWAREIGGNDGRLHYHMLLLFNKDAYYTLGNLRLEIGTLYSMIRASWASAIGIHFDFSGGLVNVAGSFWLQPTDGYASRPELFKSVSYLCKEHTKHYGGSVRSFDCSRN
ncbi:inovirus Gp2 family protein [Marinobacterium aestuarii]|uniref:inovirus Gp2 family protein n=1 Tax=Marinobacterium aestuarii TaxID=1821621 RepID=UPI000A04E76C|nr:inovirus Gp2 family protein [Marinobacterium aestuarii]